MFLLSCGLFIFLGVHSLRMLAPNWRMKLIQKCGSSIWKAAFSVVSLLGFALLCWAYGQARQQAAVLWSLPQGMRHLTVLLMLVSWVLLLAAYVPGNSIKARVHHPMLLSVQVWALAHLLANGGSAQLLLFGSFLLWPVSFRCAKMTGQPGRYIAAGACSRPYSHWCWVYPCGPVFQSTCTSC